MGFPKIRTDRESAKHNQLRLTGPADRSRIHPAVTIQYGRTGRKGNSPARPLIVREGNETGHQGSDLIHLTRHPLARCTRHLWIRNDNRLVEDGWPLTIFLQLGFVIV